MLSRLAPTLVSAALVLLLASCGLPKDPDGATDRILATRVLRVGVADNPPWIDLSGGEPSGIEAELVRRFAATLGARVQWVKGSESGLLKALEKRELDLFAGGLDSKSPWKSRIGMSWAFASTKWLVAVPNGRSKPDSLRGLHVAVPEGTAAAAKLESKGALPVRFETGSSRAVDAVALHDFEASSRNLRPTRFTLSSERHVLAAAPGENQLLLRLDRFLLANKDSIQTQLEAKGRL